MAACRGAWRTFLQCYLVLTPFLHLTMGQSNSDYFFYHVEPSLHLNKRDLGTSVDSSNVTLPANVTAKVVPTVALPTTNTTSASPQGSSTVPTTTDSPVLPDTVAWSNDPLASNSSILQEHNISKTEEDHHKYYNSTFIVDPKLGSAYWVNMSNRTDVKTNWMLSKSHRRAATVRLSFDFPFYGHMVRNVTIATGGFLYTGDFVHSWLAATQYIAPLMANFDTSLSNNSFVKFVDNGTAFTVQWERVVLQDKPDSGDFTFQVTLHSNGDIVFVYKHVPLLIEAISDDSHPVKVGISDAYIVDRNIFFVRRKTIYEYHRLQFAKGDIKNWTVIYLYALPTCVELKDCHSCLANNIGFECQWCVLAGRCSDGMDRYRQDWMYQECHLQNFTTVDQCDAARGSPVPSTRGPAVMPTGQGDNDLSSMHAVVHTKESTSSAAGTIVGVFIGAFVLLVVVVWFTYAYRNPHTTSGQILIKYRPSQLRWRRRGEARYTAATIHM